MHQRTVHSPEFFPESSMCFMLANEQVRDRLTGILLSV